MSQACLPGVFRLDAGREFVQSKLWGNIRIERTLLLVYDNASTPTRDEKGELYRNRGKLTGKARDTSSRSWITRASQWFRSWYEKGAGNRIWTSRTRTDSQIRRNSSQKQQLDEEFCKKQRRIKLGLPITYRPFKKTRDEKKVEVGWLRRRERVEESGRGKFFSPKLTVRDQSLCVWIGKEGGYIRWLRLREESWPCLAGSSRPSS